MTKILGAMPIGGEYHSEGGTPLPPQLTNGLPVEAQRGELLLQMSDGGVVILNREQQARLKKGESIESIMKTLPRYSGKAQEGTLVSPDIPPAMLKKYRDEYVENDFYSNYMEPERRFIYLDTNAPPVASLETPGSTIPSQTRESIISGTSRPRASENRILSIVPQKYGSASIPYKYTDYNMISKPNLNLDTTLQIPKTELKKGFDADMDLPRFNKSTPMRFRAATGTLSNPVYNEEEGPPLVDEKERDYFDEYNRNLLTSTLISAGNATNQGLGALLDMMKNKNKPKLGPTTPVGYAPTQAILESPESYLNALKMMMASGLRTGREAGMMPQELAQVMSKYPESVSNIQEQVSKTNTGRLLGIAELNSQNALRAGMAKMDSDYRDKTLSLQEDAIRTEADARSKDVLNKSMAWMSGLFGQYSENKFTSDIVKDVYEKKGDDSLSYLAQLLYNKE